MCILLLLFTGYCPECRGVFWLTLFTGCCLGHCLALSWSLASLLLTPWQLVNCWCRFWIHSLLRRVSPLCVGRRELLVRPSELFYFVPATFLSCSLLSTCLLILFLCLVQIPSLIIAVSLDAPRPSCMSSIFFIIIFALWNQWKILEECRLAKIYNRNSN